MLRKPKIETKAEAEVNEQWTSERSDEWVEIDRLVVDTTYQRGLEPRKVQRIASEFDPDSFGSLVVSERPDGTMAIIDGGHRVAAYRELGWSDQKVPATVLRNLTVEDEARIFSTYNENRTKPKAADIFRADVIAGKPDAVAVNDVVEGLGLRVSVSPGPNAIRSVKTLLRIHKIGGSKLVHDTLWTVLSAYTDHHSNTFNHDFMFALSVVIRDNKDINMSRLAKTIGKRGTPSAFLADGRSVASLTETKPLNETANLIVRTYNKGLRKDRLEEYAGTGAIW